MSSGSDLDCDKETEDCKSKNVNTSSGTESEEDDQENSSYDAMGYMPLSQDPDVDDDNEDSNCVLTNGDVDLTETSCCSTDDDTVRHPKPVEGNATPMSSIEENQVDEIKAAMSRFSLPPSAVPEWAKHVPENVWKSELIKGIRTKKDDSR